MSGKSSYDELNFAKLDTDRKSRTGFSEVVFCQGKKDNFLKEIFLRLYKSNGEVMGTRADKNQAELVKKAFEGKKSGFDKLNRRVVIEPAVTEQSRSVEITIDNPAIKYDEISRIISVKNEIKEETKNLIGNIAVCTAGTADIPVAEEAAQTAEFFGSKVSRVYDVGVSGIHRLLSKLEILNEANCVIAVAGMEGALASVVGGLVSVPVIAVPTSVGYGASLGGLSALLTMINSCANGISVVNIDNGYGAGYIATQINRLAEKGKSK